MVVPACNSSAWEAKTCNFEAALGSLVVPGWPEFQNEPLLQTDRTSGAAQPGEARCEPDTLG